MKLTTVVNLFSNVADNTQCCSALKVSTVCDITEKNLMLSVISVNKPCPGSLFFARDFLPVPFGRPLLAVLHGCHFLAGLSFQFFSSRLILAGLCWQPYPSRSVLEILSWLSCSACPVLPILF